MVDLENMSILISDSEYNAQSGHINITIKVVTNVRYYPTQLNGEGWELVFNFSEKKMLFDKVSTFFSWSSLDFSFLESDSL